VDQPGRCNIPLQAGLVHWGAHDSPAHFFSPRKPGNGKELFAKFIPNLGSRSWGEPCIRFKLRATGRFDQSGAFCHEKKAPFTKRRSLSALSVGFESSQLPELVPRRKKCGDIRLICKSSFIAGLAGGTKKESVLNGSQAPHDYKGQTFAVIAATNPRFFTNWGRTDIQLWISSTGIKNVFPNQPGPLCGVGGAKTIGSVLARICQTTWATRMEQGRFLFQRSPPAKSIQANDGLLLGLSSACELQNFFNRGAP